VDAKYHAGKTAFLVLSISNMIDLTIGVTGALIITSPAWRFEFFCSVVLLLLSIPLNIALTRWKGMDGTAMATLITFVIYNIIRLIFIKRRFNMWPFSRKTVYALLLAIGSYLISWFLLHHIPGLIGIILRSTLFSSLFIAGVFYLHLTPDLPQVIEVVRKRLGKKE
jgi:O-antigen/teichoic acid export membrane protein